MEAVVSREHGVQFTGFRFAGHRLGPEAAVERGFVRRRRWQHWTSLAAGFPVALAAIARFRPHVVMSKGSQVSIPVVLAARAQRVPVVIHESDAVVGWENQRLAPLATTFCAGEPELAATLDRPVTVTGNLTRPGLAGGSATRGRERFGVPPDRPLVYVTGGSQGATSLNALLTPILSQLTRRYFVVHQCGPGKLVRRFLPGYVPVEFVGEELRDIYAASTLVVARAGAATIAELTHYRVPAVLVPSPWAADDHQLQNARLFARYGVCSVLRQQDLTPDRLLKAIDDGVATADDRRVNYTRVPRIDAVDRIIEELLAAANVSEGADRRS